MGCSTVACSPFFRIVDTESVSTDCQGHLSLRSGWFFAHCQLVLRLTLYGEGRGLGVGVVIGACEAMIGLELRLSMLRGL